MTETKHTPEDWMQSHRKCPDGKYRTQVYPASDPNNTIATVHWHSVKTPDGYTTDRAQLARLIAAAPDLLEALKEIREMLWSRPDISERLRPLMGFAEEATNQKAAAAIAKAEGGDA
jgi:hypothetical protein